MTGLLTLLAIGLTIFWIVAVVYVAWTLTHPPRRTYASAVARGRPGDPSELPGPPRPWSAWTFRTRGLELPVWEIRGDDPGGPTVVLTHGWADSRIGGLVRVPFLAPHVARVVLWDLPGHGEAPGISRLGTAEVDDLRALLEHLGPDAAPVVLYGWSLGAGVSVAAAARGAEIAGVVAEAPYRLPETPARNVVRARGLPWRTNLAPAFWILGTLFGVGPRWRGFDRAAWAARLRCPLLVLHGDCDVVCPAEDGRALAAAAPSGRLVAVADGGHNTLWTDPVMAGECAAAVGSFLQKAKDSEPDRARSLSEG